MTRRQPILAPGRLALNVEQVAPAEFVRRAERGLGVAIREGQADGTVETVSEGKSRGSAVRDDVVTYDEIKPKPTDFAGKYELSNTHGGIYDLTDGVSDEQFEESIAEAKDEGNLSRANVARKAKGKAQIVDPAPPSTSPNPADMPVHRKRMGNKHPEPAAPIAGKKPLLGPRPARQHTNGGSLTPSGCTPDWPSSSTGRHSSTGSVHCIAPDPGVNTPLIIRFTRSRPLGGPDENPHNPR